MNAKEVPGVLLCIAYAWLGYAIYSGALDYVLIHLFLQRN
jgi:hypothetical protein